MNGCLSQKPHDTGRMWNGIIKLTFQKKIYIHTRLESEKYLGSKHLKIWNTKIWNVSLILMNRKKLLTEPGIFLITSNPIQNRAEEYNQRWLGNTKSKQTSDWIPFTNFLNNGEQSFSLKISMSPIIREVKRLRWAGPEFENNRKIFARSNLGMLTDNYG